MECNRCYTETNTHTMSMFNIEDICMDCKKKEREHPHYEKARQTEADQVRQGNYNFQGIGKPKDL
jgi:hypothetical protein